MILPSILLMVQHLYSTLLIFHYHDCSLESDLRSRMQCGVVTVLFCHLLKVYIGQGVPDIPEAASDTIL